MTLLRITGGLWLSLWLVCLIGGLVHGGAAIDWNYWQLDLILIAIFTFIAFLDYSVFRGSGWASKPLGIVALLLGVWMLFIALAAGFSFGVICLLLFSAWTFWISICKPEQTA